MDGAGGAHGLALAAELALGRVYVSNVAFHDYGFVRAGFGADAATYAGVGTGLLGNRALVLVHAAYKHPHAAGTFGPELDDALGAGLHAGAAGGALFLVHYRKTCGRIHGKGAKLADSHAVPATKASVRASSIPGIEGRFHLARCKSVIVIDGGTGVACAIASDHCNHGSLFLDLVAKDGSHFGHSLVAANGAIVVVQVRGLDGGLCKGSAAGKPATAAVGSGHGLFYIVNARILLYLEALGNKEKDQRKDQAQSGNHYDCPE